MFGVQNDCFSFASTFFLGVTIIITVATFMTTTCVTAITHFYPVSYVVVFCLLLVCCVVVFLILCSKKQTKNHLIKWPIKAIVSNSKLHLLGNQFFQVYEKLSHCKNRGNFVMQLQSWFCHCLCYYLSLSLWHWDFMCIYMCVYMCVCACVHACVRICVCVCVCMCVCVCVCKLACAHLSVNLMSSLSSLSLSLSLSLSHRLRHSHHHQLPCNL